MKRILLGLCVLLGMSGAYAGEESTSGPDPSAEHISRAICYYYVKSSGDPVGDMLKAAKKHMRFFTEFKYANNEQMMQYFNEHKDEMTCGEEEKLYTKVAFDEGAHLVLFHEFIFKRLKPKKKNPLLADMNAVDFSNNGKPETLLNYINNIKSVADHEGSAAKFSSETLNDIRAILIETFGAKTFAQLPADVQAKYLKQSKAKK